MKRALLLFLSVSLLLAIAVPSVVGAAGPGSRNTASASDVTAVGVVTEVEAEGLAFMYEEEKLARDVYSKLNDTWDLAIFGNIARGEQSHMDAVGVLLDRYGLAVPVGAPGVFQNADLQVLYTQLVAQGSASLVEALKVGVNIEEIDIADLQERIAQTDKADIQRVYGNLLRGSQNHLRAFTSSLARQGETYTSQYQAAEEPVAVGSPSSGNAGPSVGGRGGRWAR